MTLSALIRRREPGNPATAIPAISATQQRKATGTVAKIATVAVANPQSPKTAPIPDLATQTRRQRVLTMLVERSGIRYAALTDTKAVPGSVLLTLAVRHVGTVELLIPADKWDGVLFLEMLECHTLH